MDCWYFAYGSNLLSAQMIARTGPLRTGGEHPRIAHLTGYRLAFNMLGEDRHYYANILQPGDGVFGVLYRCDPEAMRKLDAFERGYERREVVVADKDSRVVDAVAYVLLAQHETTAGQPGAAYLQKILTGAREHGLPQKYLMEIEALASTPI